MSAATLRRWSGWAPGCEDAEAWQRWSARPAPLAAQGRPEARFLPAMLRRRCSPLARMMLTAAFACCEEEELPRVATVFASRHGNINESIGLLERLAEGLPLSPLRFSHTVHNAQAGLFSIAAGNRQASSSISAGEDSFGCGYVEALTLLERTPERPVLLVMGDAPLAATFSHLVDEPPATYAVALLLAREGPGTALAFRAAQQAQEPSPPRPWPQAAEFLRWHLSGEKDLQLGRWRWERA